jgi:GSH-dependent disulfide-bond oxidoreductase
LYQQELPVGKAKLQLYSLGSPNGQKVTCMLEELGLPYDAWYTDIMKEEQVSSCMVIKLIHIHICCK